MPKAAPTIVDCKATAQVSWLRKPAVSRMAPIETQESTPAALPIDEKITHLNQKGNFRLPLKSSPTLT